MLGIGVNVDINIKETHYPITFEGVNVCVHCGGVDTLEMIDTFGRVVKAEVHAFDHIKCNNCGASYSIRWDKGAGNSYTPVAIDPSIKQQFKNFIADKFKRMELSRGNF